MNVDSWIFDEDAHNEAFALVTCPECLEDCDSIETCENCKKEDGDDGN